MTYTRTGPFSNNSQPALNATFFNAVEDALVSINSAAIDTHVSADGTGLLTVLGLNVAAAPTSITGTTSGGITLYQPFRGPSFKMVIMRLTQYRNNGGHTQGIVLPAAFTARCKVWCGDMPSTGVQFQKSGVTQNIAVPTSVSTTGNSVTNVPTLFRHTYGEILSESGWDTMIIPTGGTAIADGVIFIVGW